MNKPNYILDIPADEYHKATKDNKFLSSHRLAIFRRCPAEYKKVRDGEIVQGETAAFLLGRATHTLILEGRTKFDAEFTVSEGPVNEKTGKPYGTDTKAYKEWAEAQETPIIRTADFELIEKMRVAVDAHEVAHDLLRDGFAEGTVRATWGRVPVQARPDWFDPERGILVDLKTCNDLDRFRFDVRDFGYVFQLAFYERCLRLAGYTSAVPITPWLIAVEKKEPFRVGVYKLTSATIADANEMLMRDEHTRMDNDAMIAEFEECLTSNKWPTRYEGFGII